MKNLGTLVSIAHTLRRTLGVTLTLAVLALPAAAAADAAGTADHGAIRSGWSANFTPALLVPRYGDDRLGGGVDPELKYTVDLGGARLSAGGRLGVYYARNLFGVTAMPTLRLMVPVGPVEPYVAFGMGYGWIPKLEHADHATMSRLGVVFRLSERFALGLEGTVQKIDGSDFRFPSVGSMVSFDL